MEPALQKWYENRGRELVERSLRAAHSYVYATPSLNFTDEFLQKMDSTLDERDFFVKDWKHRNGELEISDDPLGLDNVQDPDSIDDLFCDECRELSFTVAVKGEKHFCGGCWNDLGLSDQEGLYSFEEIDTGDHYALVGCGAAKQEGRLPAREKYSSTYFKKKREFAESLADDWWILSAKYGAITPDRMIEDYDKSIDDVDTTGWYNRVTAFLERETEVSEEDTVWVLLGKKYLEAETGDGDSLRGWLNSWKPSVRYPFDETSDIGKQNQYLDQAVEYGQPVMPHRLPGFNGSGQTQLDAY